MVHFPLMFLSEWRELPSAPLPCRGGGTWWQLTSPCCWNRVRRLPCFLSASVRRKDLQFGTLTDPFQTTLSSPSYDMGKKAGLRTYQHLLVNKSIGRTVPSTCQFMNVKCWVHKNFGVGCVFSRHVQVSPGNVGGKLLRISVGIQKKNRNGKNVINTG